MAIAIPYQPPGGKGKLAVILNYDIKSYLGLYEPNSGILSTMPVDEANESSRIFWSPDQTQIAYY